jgi:predicted anti-sigma-YlaC factor YlaD
MANKCEDYLSGLADYIDGTIDPELCAEIEKHIGKCNNCRIMVDTFKQTVKLCREGKPEPLPPILEEKLMDLLRAKWDQKFGKSGA